VIDTRVGGKYAEGYRDTAGHDARGDT